MELDPYIIVCGVLAVVAMFVGLLIIYFTLPRQHRHDDVGPHDHEHK